MLDIKPPMQGLFTRAFMSVSASWLAPTPVCLIFNLNWQCEIYMWVSSRISFMIFPRLSHHKWRISPQEEQFTQEAVLLYSWPQPLMYDLFLCRSTFIGTFTGTFVGLCRCSRCRGITRIHRLLSRPRPFHKANSCSHLYS